MSGMTSIRQPHDYQVKDYEEFMLNYRYSLVNAIETEHAIPWLIHNEVLDSTDQEIILNTHNTRVLRAGDMIDTVLRKGPRGFNVLMEIIEYEYCELYEKMMKLPARQPDESAGYRTQKGRLNRLSKACEDAITKLLLIMDVDKKNKITKEKAEKAEAELKGQITHIQAELEMSNRQIMEQIQKVLEVEAHNKELHEQLQQAKKEQAETDEQMKTLRLDRDHALNQVMSEKEKHMSQSRQAIQHIREISVKDKNRPQPQGDLRAELEQLRKEVQMLRRQPSRQQSIDEEVKRLQDLLKELRKENEMMECDKACLDEQFQHLAEEFDCRESSTKQYIDQVRSLQHERDRILRQHDELKQNFDALQQERNQMYKGIIDSNSKLRFLQNEADSCVWGDYKRQRLPDIRERNSVKQPVGRQGPPGLGVPLHMRGEILQDNFTSFNQDSASDEERETATRPNTLPRTSNRQHPIRLLSEQPNEMRRTDGAILRQASRDDTGATEDGTPLNQKDLVVSSNAVATGSCIYSPPSPVSKDKPKRPEPPWLRDHPRRLPSPCSPDTGPFHRSINLITAKKKCPLVLYSPKPLRYDLQRHLLEEHSNCFIDCPYERLEDERHKMLPDWLEAGRIIHYTKQQDGVYLCLGTDALQYYTKMDDCGHVLLDVPVEAIQRMLSQKITPYVLVVKYQDLDLRGEKSEEEMEMDKMHPDYRSSYEMLIINRSTGIESIASQIVHKITTYDASNGKGKLNRNCNAAPPPGNSSSA